MDNTKIPARVWKAIATFGHLARKHPDKLRQAVTAFIDYDKQNPYPETPEAETALAVARLVCATERVLEQSTSPRKAELSGIKPILQHLGLSVENERDFATLMFGNWPTEWPAIDAGLKLVKQQWASPPRVPAVAILSVAGSPRDAEAHEDRRKAMIGFIKKSIGLPDNSKKAALWHLEGRSNPWIAERLKRKKDGSQFSREAVRKMIMRVGRELNITLPIKMGGCATNAMISDKEREESFDVRAQVDANMRRQGE